ncbi:hypothetical protein JW960_14235 [candidate division KSB1 bacterium]|nr:hypothetical protein [candidate division KSB1 bacterium]
MNVNPDFKYLLKILYEFNVKYLLAGGYAVMYNAEPRFTKDIDIWIEPSKENASNVWKALMKFGAPLEQVTVDDFCDKD